jgi:hypothetical protein
VIEKKNKKKINEKFEDFIKEVLNVFLISVFPKIKGKITEK